MGTRLGSAVRAHDRVAPERDSQASCYWGPETRAGASGNAVQGSVALPTYLAEAVEAGQGRSVERKVSHCGREERGGISDLKQGPVPSGWQALVTGHQ